MFFPPQYSYPYMGPPNPNMPLMYSPSLPPFNPYLYDPFMFGTGGTGGPGNFTQIYPGMPGEMEMLGLDHNPYSEPANAN